MSSAKLNFLRNCFNLVTVRITSCGLRIVAAAVLISCACASAQTLTTLHSFGSDSRDGVDPQVGVVFDGSLGGEPRWTFVPSRFPNGMVSNRFFQCCVR